MTDVEKKFPGKRRSDRTVPLALGVVARLTQGEMMASSSQFLTTKPPGPNPRPGWLAIVGVVKSVHNQEHVVLSVQTSLSVASGKSRAHSPNGDSSWMLTKVPTLSEPLSKLSVRVPDASVIEMLSNTAPAPIVVGVCPSHGENPASEKKAMYTQWVPGPLFASGRPDTLPIRFKPESA